MGFGGEMKKIIVIILIIVVAVVMILWQKNIYENRVVLLEDRIVGLEDEILSLASKNDEIRNEIEASYENYEKLETEKQELSVRMEKVADDNKELASNIEELENKLSDMKYDMIKDNLPDYWHNIWDNIYTSEGVLSDRQIEEINFLLQPVFSHTDWTEINPLSCFFTSYYEDVKDINLTAFLRYFPNGEVLEKLPEKLPEFEELKSHENWPFGDTINSIFVPIHRYKRKVVQDIFTAYAGISMNELTGVGFDEILYLESTDAYYNFTSDFGPGHFFCTGGIVEDGVIRLYRNSRSKLSILTIVKVADKYVIKSLYEE